MSSTPCLSLSAYADCPVERGGSSTGRLLSIRACSDISLKIEIRRVFEQNFRVCGVRKVWRQCHAGRASHGRIT
ncbi:hypothetical protein GHK29_12485 [Sinorhizobium medicae]|nr:hypothetical protein [Sinorhizobium medicae]MQU75440.1 hypothetical protein [Sinorhizobium medicae]